MKESTLYKVFWYKITVKPKQGHDSIEVLIWKDLPFAVRTKYDWYFKYRAALLQVKYPKYVVDCNFGSEEADKKTIAYAIKNKIINRKAQISKYRHLIKLAKDNWNSLFPIEDDATYNRALTKIDLLEIELKELQEQFNTLK